MNASQIFLGTGARMCSFGCKDGRRLSFIQPDDRKASIAHPSAEPPAWSDNPTLDIDIE